MIRNVLAAAAAILFAGSAHAQDYTGNVDPSAYSLPTVMHSAINARAKNGARVQRRTSSREAAAICANELPRVRARYGSNDRRVVRLARLCRQGGY